MYICKRIVKLICHRRSNMLRVSQCCVIGESNHNSAKFLSFFFFPSSFSALDPHRECFRLFLDLCILKFCFRRYDKHYSKKREQFNSQFKGDNFTYDIYVIYFTLKLVKKKNMFLPPEKYLL